MKMCQDQFLDVNFLCCSCPSSGAGMERNASRSTRSATIGTSAGTDRTSRTAVGLMGGRYHRDECGDGSDEQDCGRFNGGEIP